MAVTPMCCRAVLLVVTCLSAAVLAQTFQYSRGWTNGKRAGAAWIDQDKMAPCQMRLFVAGRDTHQLYFPCELFRHLSADDVTERRLDDATERRLNDVSERFRRKPTPTADLNDNAEDENIK